MQKECDIREVERDLALIKSPAIGMKRISTMRYKGLLIEEEETEETNAIEVDTSLALEPAKAASKEEAKISEIHESDNEMEVM